MISEQDGKSRSFRTALELERSLKVDLENLTEEEREVLLLMLAEMNDPGAKMSGIYEAASAGEFKRPLVDMETFIRDKEYLGNTCENCYTQVLEDMKELFSGGYHEVVFTGAIGWGKCLRKSRTYVFDCSTGERKRIEDFENSAPLVPSLSGEKIEPVRASKVWPSGRKECARLELASGQWLEASWDHPVLGPDGYVTLAELRPGDFVACARTCPSPSKPIQISDAEVAVAAYLIADGSLTWGKHDYVKGDRRLVDDFRSYVSDVPGFDGFGRECFERGAWYVSFLGLNDWLIDLGVDCRSKEKRVPPEFFGLSDRQLALFLNRIFTDGSVYTGSPRKIELALASEGLIDDVQELLRRFGVVARKSFKPKRSVKGGPLHDAWRLQIADAPSQLMFLAAVGPIFGKEVSCEELRHEAEKVNSNPNWDVVPITAAQLKEIRKETGPHTNAAWRKMGSLAAGSYMGRAKFKRLCERTGYKGRFRKFAEMDVVWERVTSVEGIGTHEVYDLTVPGTQNVVANGIVVHNTFAASIGICRIIYELSCMHDPHMSFGLAKDSNISIVNLSVNEALATKVVFENIATKIKSSPYFSENFPFSATKKELRFPGNIWVAARATTDGSVLGLNTISALMDECVSADTLVLTEKGPLRAEDLFLDGTPFRTVTFDFDTNEPVVSDAWIKRSSDQECFDLELDNGTILRASHKHPVAIRSNGIPEFKYMRDILPGEEVITYAEEGTKAVRRGEGEDSRGRKEAHGREESLLRKNAFSRGARLGIRGMGRKLSVGRVVSKRSVGVLPTYDVCVPGFEVFVADGVLVHNTNFMHKVKGAEGAAKRWGKVDHAEQLYAAIKRRMKSRFERKGRLPGMIFVVSSKKTSDDFTAKRVREARNDPSIFVRDYCLTGDTRIPLLDGTEPTIRELTELYGGSESTFEVYSFDTKTGRVVPGIASHPRCTARKERVLEVELDNGEVVRATPWHPFMLKTGEYVKAEDLQVGDSLMPLYRRVNEWGYEEVGQPWWGGRWQKTHHMSARSLFGTWPKIGSDNLKVVSIREGGLEDVYDLTVSGLENFAVGAGVFVHNSIWDVKPKHYFSDKVFHVLVGNDQVPSRIIEDEEELQTIQMNVPDGCVISEVPDDFRIDFEADLEGAIRDIAGIATVSVSPFIQRREKIMAAVDKDRTHPFSSIVYDPARPGSFMWDRLVSDQPRNRSYRDVESTLRPIVNPTAPRHVHIDPSLRGDATGLCVAHVAGLKDVIRRADDGRQFIERAPVYYVDLILQIVPPAGGEIVLADVRHLIYDLTAHGFMITTVSLDSWQSADSIQILKSKGYKSELVSMDTNPDAYDNLKTALYEERVRMYRYKPVLDELIALQEDRAGRKRKIDHPPSGSKDCSDALAGVCFTLSRNAVKQPLPMMTSVDHVSDPWMDEQHQAILGGQDRGSGNEFLPALLVGVDGDDWDGGSGPF